MKYIEEHWHEYETSFMDLHGRPMTTTEQREMKRIYYCGAAAITHALKNAPNLAHFHKRLEDIYREVDLFLDAISGGRA